VGPATKTSLFILSIVNMIMMPSCAALFLLRLRAVYLGNNYVMVFFGCCWLSILSCFVYETSRGLSRCLDFQNSIECFPVHHIDAYGYIAMASYDTIMYLAISWHLASFAPYIRWQDRLRSFVTGEGLGWLSRVLLQSGQLYFL